MGTTCKGRRPSSTTKSKEERQWQKINRRGNRAQRRSK